MEIVPLDLVAAAAGAREKLAHLARDAATAGARAASGELGRPVVSGAAREAIFADALLGALHARLEELKGVAK
jgi:hypothetical protein